jgi:hypothetical protein
VLRPGRSIAHRCSARLAPGMIKLKLEGFRQHWHAEQDKIDDRRFTYLVAAADGSWRRWLGRRPGLRVCVAAPPPSRGTMAEIAVEITPCDCGPAEAARLLEEAGPELLESLRSFLQPAPERRRHERLPLARAIEVWPATCDGDALAAELRDVSEGGLGLWTPGPPPGEELLVRLTTPEDDGALIPVHVVRARPRPDGRYDVGVCFALNES